MKIRTPQQFALFCSVMLGVLFMILICIVSEFSDVQFSLSALVIATIIFSALTFGVLYVLLEKLITRKIRLLYRTIHNFKINKGDFPVSMREDVLARTEKEVMLWAQSSREEIDRLKQEESFRREFLGNLAHELKTPVFSIQGYILTLLEGGLEDNKVNRKFLEIASKGVDRVTAIIQDLDVITRMESEDVPLDIKKVNLLELAKEIIDGLKIQADMKAIKLQIDNKYSGEVLGMCDRDKIGQVFSNLIVNSINYGKEGGVTKVRFFDFEDNILVEVADNGIGIDKKHLSRLFERFYRVDKSRSRSEGGSGLGLAIVKHIVEKHDQTINVRSSINEGSTFSFTIKRP